MDSGRNGTDRGVILCGFLLAVATLAQGFYALYLHNRYYSQYGPFFDSVSYTNRLADYYHRSRTEGPLATLRAELPGDTVVLPYLEIVLLSPLISLSRSVAIWLQWVWLLALALSVYFFLARYRGSPPWLAACLAAPFVSFGAIYDYNGGLSDFRMDLSQYLFFALTGTWYLATYETESRTPWVLAGVSATLGCLARATLPVHFAFALGPLILLRFWRAEPGRRVRLLRRCAWMLAPPIAVGGAYFLSNFDCLYYYYAVWNADANAALPLRESLRHFLVAALLAGGTAAAMAVVLVLQLSAGVRTRGWATLDLKPLWMGTAPPLFLALAGTSPGNPFVSMPALFGWILFCVAPLRGALCGPSRWHRLAVALVALLGSLWDASSGIAAHVRAPREADMNALKTVVRLLLEDAGSRGKQEVSYACSHVGALQSYALRNVLLYEFGGTPSGAKVTLPGGISLSGANAHLFQFVVPVEWESQIPGKTDAEKIEALVRIAEEGLDYIVLPDEATLGFLETHLSHNLFNTKTRSFRSRLLASGRWERISGPVPITTHETVLVYRNSR
jgi:hypothetical protein